ncbi:MAG: phosphatase PAP2 family protein [Pseudomonadota bacterium]
MAARTPAGFWPARCLVFWGLALVVLAAGAHWVCPGGTCVITAFDHAGLALAENWRPPGLAAAMTAITWLGSLFLLVPLTAWLAWRRLRAGRANEGRFLLAALLGAAALAHAAKLWVARPRPEPLFAWVDMPADWSYPSAHAMQAVAFVLALVLVAGRPLRGWLVSMLLIALLVGVSRVYLHVHYPSDVVIGALAAVFWVWGLHGLMFPRAAGDGANRFATGGR